MHENKFEKEVSEKMDQLGFDPSDAVWTRVDREINKEKRKRRPFFWIFFFSGLLLGSAGVYTVMQINSPEKTSKVYPEISAGKEQKTVQGGEPGKEIPVDNKNNKNINAGTSLSTVPSNTYKDRLALSHFKNSYRKGYLKSETEVDSEKYAEDQKYKEQKTIEGENTKGKSSGSDETTGKIMPAVAAAKEQNSNKTLTTDTASAIQSGVGGKQNLKTSPWSFAITATAGISDINQSLFQSVNAANNSYYAYTPNAISAPPPPAPYTSSAIQPGFSFGVGILVNRKLSKRVSLSAGLDYHYYSTKIHTGLAVDSSRYVYAPYGQTASVNSFYQNGQTQSYTNQYHFIELPVSLSLQMNKSIKNPLNWEAGFSLAWMLGTNALHFDPNTNVYFENDQLFNKTQWNATTAILVGFPVNKHSIQLGPQLQYGLSGLLKTNGSNPGHLFYFGMKISFIP